MLLLQLTKNQRGTGLVSAIEACERNGIEVKVDSKIGSGTKITLNISDVMVSS
ncbi:MAG: hypothetical protein GX556_10130 [Fibrobacter sp.]|nr:hypothetical protein [Fibrobacter sp.]